MAVFTYENERVKGIEPSCAAWEAAVLPLNYTREEIFDFRFAIADCNRNKFARHARTTPNHCHEITSSEFTYIPLPFVPSVPSAPNDQLITPIPTPMSPLPSVAVTYVPARSV